jgi:hypothetical protein
MQLDLLPSQYPCFGGSLLRVYVVQNESVNVSVHTHMCDALLPAAACRCVLTGAQLLAEGLSDKGGFAAGFDWAEEQLRQAGLGKIAAEVSR